MNTRASIAPVRPRTDRALAAATEILRIVSDADDHPDLPAGELLCRVWKFIIAEFDAIEREISNG